MPQRIFILPAGSLFHPRATVLEPAVAARRKFYWTWYPFTGRTPVNAFSLKLLSRLCDAAFEIEVA
jgi:hypothetical protein